MRSIIYNSKDGKANRKSAPAALYALITEVAKWDVVLKEVIEGAGLLKLESKVCLRNSRVAGSRMTEDVVTAHTYHLPTTRS